MAEVVSTAVKSVGFLKYMKLAFLMIWIAYLLLNAISLGIKQPTSEQGISVAVQKISSYVFEPLQTAQEAGQNIKTGKDIFDSIFIYWGFYSSLYTIYLWLKLFAFLIGHSPWSNDSNKFINWSASIIIFYVLTTIYSIYFLKSNIAYPYTAIKEIINDLINIFAG